MRLNPQYQHTIKHAVSEVMGANCQVWLFGSRVNDALKGGDIDLMIESPCVIANKVKALTQLEAKFFRMLGDRKVNVIIKDPDTQEVGVYAMAKKTGIKL